MISDKYAVPVPPPEPVLSHDHVLTFLFVVYRYIGLILAILSTMAIGTSFVITKKVRWRRFRLGTENPSRGHLRLG